MSNSDIRDTAKKIVVIIIAAILIQAGTAIFQTFVTKSEVRQNAKKIEKLDINSQQFVLKFDNAEAHKALLKNAETNAKAITDINKQMRTDQKYIMDKLENINNNILNIRQQN